MSDLFTSKPLPQLDLDPLTADGCAWSALRTLCLVRWALRDCVVAHIVAVYNRRNEEKRRLREGYRCCNKDNGSLISHDTASRALRGRGEVECPDCKDTGIGRDHTGYLNGLVSCKRCGGRGRIATGGGIAHLLHGTGWTLLSKDGYVCLCRDEEQDKMLKQLEDR